MKKNPYQDQESRLLMRGLQATYELKGLNVQVQNITMLYQSPKQYKGLKSRKHSGFQ